MMRPPFCFRRLALFNSNETFFPPCPNVIISIIMSKSSNRRNQTSKTTTLRYHFWLQCRGIQNHSSGISSVVVISMQCLILHFLLHFSLSFLNDHLMIYLLARVFRPVHIVFGVGWFFFSVCLLWIRCFCYSIAQVFFFSECVVEDNDQCRMAYARNAIISKRFHFITKTIEIRVCILSICRCENMLFF